MTKIQELLNQEAKLCNTGFADSEERKAIHEIIREKRGTEAPVCFGHDDCSTLILSMCPWRMDCGK